MDLKQLFDDFQYQDLQWFIPVLGGLVVVVLSMVVALVRGLTSGVLAALVLGGLLSLSPTLLQALERRAGAGAGTSTEVARGAARLAVANGEVTSELTDVLRTLRSATAGLLPTLSANGDVAGNPIAMQVFTQGLADTGAALDRTSTKLEELGRERAALQASLLRLDASTETMERRR